jgi:Amt family ammonium transporter
MKKLAWGSTALAASLLLLAGPAAAQDAPVPDKGDVAWMLVSTILVLLMIVPGLALFYGGLVRTKNMLSVLMQVLTVTAIVMIVWVLWGYSMAFTDGGSLNAYVGGFSKALLAGVDTTTLVETFSVGVVIPELVFVAFQMTFAAITTALVLGGIAERIKFSAVVAFAIIWPTLVYFPMAHMVWWWPGPGFAATNPADATVAGAGMIWGFGALDFAGGTVVHINAGIAALVGAIILGKRVGYGKEPMAPHSLTLTMVGAGLLWVGWFGFNAGSNLESNAYAALAMLNTFVATAAAALAWPAAEWLTKGKPSLLGAVSGAVAGLVAVTPAAGFIGVHGIGGIVGAIGTGILVDPALGGAGIVDYTTGMSVYPGLAVQVMAQLKGVLTTLIWSGVGSTIVFLLIKFTIGLRVPEASEREGLDVTSHGERAYNM